MPEKNIFRLTLSSLHAFQIINFSLFNKIIAMTILSQKKMKFFNIPPLWYKIIKIIFPSIITQFQLAQTQNLIFWSRTHKVFFLPSEWCFRLLTLTPRNLREKEEEEIPFPHPKKYSNNIPDKGHLSLYILMGIYGNFDNKCEHAKYPRKTVQNPLQMGLEIKRN